MTTSLKVKFNKSCDQTKCKMLYDYILYNIYTKNVKIQVAMDILAY